MRCIVMKKTQVFLILNIILLSLLIYFSFSFATTFVMASKNYVPITGVEIEDNRIALTVNVYEDTDIESFIENSGKTPITFFISEAFESRYPERVKHITDSGHTIGILLQSMKNKTRQEVYDTVAQRIESLVHITGENTNLVRFDYNEYDNNCVKAVFSIGLFGVQWAADDSSDYFSAGDIILLTGERNIEEFTGEIITDGFEAVKVGELLLKDDYKIDLRGVQIKK